MRDQLYRTCRECARRFDLLDGRDAAEWVDGHDCQPPCTCPESERGEPFCHCACVTNGPHDLAGSDDGPPDILPDSYRPSVDPDDLHPRAVYRVHEGGDTPVYSLCDPCIDRTVDPAACRLDIIERDDAAHCFGCDYHAAPTCSPATPCPECGHDLERHSLEGSGYHLDTPGPGCRAEDDEHGPDGCWCPVERGNPDRLAAALAAALATLSVVDLLDR